MRFEELSLPLPCTERLWDAPSEQAWQYYTSNEPQGRLGKAFQQGCICIFNGSSEFDDLPLGLPDYEVGMCAMQSRLWEDTRKKHEFQRLEVDPTGTQQDWPFFAGAYAQSRPIQLEHWRKGAEECRHFGARENLFSPLTQIETNFTIMNLYHMSHLRYHSDVALVRSLAEREDDPSQNSRRRQRREILMQEWAATSDARLAVWHAAQLWRLHAEEVHFLLQQSSVVNPATRICLFTASLVVWAFCRCTKVCDECSDAGGVVPVYGEPPAPPMKQSAIELTRIDQLEDEYHNWVNGKARASVNGVILCASEVPLLMEEFRRVMATSKPEWSSYSSYLDVLDRLKEVRPRSDRGLQ